MLRCNNMLVVMCEKCEGLYDVSIVSLIHVFLILFLCPKTF